MKIHETELVVIGAGPGGYAAAFYAADLGIKTTLIEKFPQLGGVCLNVGCIPSKALLHMTAVKEEVEIMKENGLDFGQPKIDLAKVRKFKDSVIQKMTGGLKQLSTMRKVETIQGIAEFIDENNLLIKTETEEKRLIFKYAIIATGSKPIIPPVFDLKSELVMDSSDALELKDIPKEFLIIGGGVIGLEMGSVYAGLGSEVTVIEAMGQIAGGLDKDIGRVIEKKLKKSFKEIMVNTKVKSLAVKKGKVEAVYESKGQETTKIFDKVLLSIGRRPQSELLKIDKINLKIDEKGFIVVNEKMQTNLGHIFAIGDVAGNPMLAHKASREGHVAVEVISGKKTIFDNLGIPNVIYTDPEVAWVGLTENEAKAKNIEYQVGSFSWGASGRATAMNKKEGLTKILFHPKNERVLGVAIVGANAGELIAEGGLALEMGAVREDITATIHAHPTLSETFMEAAENLHGMATHMFVPKRKK